METTTHRIRALMVAMKLEADSDVHLVVADPDHRAHTMIVEFPAGTCTHGASASARRRMSRARAAIFRACGHPSASRFEGLHGTATITGVGFFDFKHGQRGVAPNAIELHPALSFRAPAC